MAKKPPLSISHAGFHVFDMARMVDFFTTVYGFHIIDHGPYEETEEITFLSTDPSDHHQLVLYSGRTKTGDEVHYNHISFRADSFARLRTIHSSLKDYPGVTRISTIVHGNAWSVYCFDPEGNRTEAFIDTPWHVAQPFGIPFELSLSDEEIYAWTEELLKDNQTVVPFDEWRQSRAKEWGLLSN
mgnify:FL=1